jgi:hypothetical protein
MVSYHSDVCGGNGVYQIFPNTSNPNGFEVYCEIRPDGNNWTVRILLRVLAIYERVSP